MATRAQKKRDARNDIAGQHFSEGLALVKDHPIFAPLADAARISRGKGSPYPQYGWALVSNSGYIYCHGEIRASGAEWAHIIAHSLLHLGMRHFTEHPGTDDGNGFNAWFWNTACDLVVEYFLRSLKLGQVPLDSSGVIKPLPANITDEKRLYERFLQEGRIPPEYTGFGMAGEKTPDMLFNEKIDRWNTRLDWQKIFATGLARGVRSAVDVAAGISSHLSVDKHADDISDAERQRKWFISTYPLLGAIAASFKLIEDIDICHRMDIRIAAVSCRLREIYINPSAGLTSEECRFVMAHEFLHAALRHDMRQDWRDAFYWNIACDFVINIWLTEMGVGERPVSALYDDSLKGMNAEAVYDRIVTDIRRLRKLSTLRGEGLGDILGDDGAWWERSDGVDLDAFYRRALAEGLSYHQTEGRGFLPEGLVEEIRSLTHPPIPWDVELARWFDDHFTPIIKTRSYARISRRQSSTPDIPRPNWVISQTALDGRTFGVVLDTSGSMERGLLATALGAIASYSVARDVPAVRVVFCDAEAYDQGYMKSEDIAGVVKIKGRGGTVLQPGIDLLVRAEDFPATAPILIITDAYCEDRLLLYGREHAFLIPRGAHLPFVAKGKVFRVWE
jgi:predicted metal-dependent peptidase